MSPEIDPPITDPQTPAPAENGSAKTVGYEHFQRVVTAKQGLESQVADLKGQLSSALERAAGVDTLAGQLTAAQASTAEAESRFATWRDVGGALGVTDPEVIELAVWSHGKLPAEGRPAIGDWLGTLQTDPATAPVALRPFITGAVPDQVPSPIRHPSPRPPAAPSSTPGAPSSISADAIRQARDIGVKTGNWARYKELSAAAGYRTPGKG